MNESPGQTVTLTLRVSGDLTATVTFTHHETTVQGWQIAGKQDRLFLDAWLNGYAAADREKAAAA